MKPIIDLRVIQTVNWMKDENAGWLKIPVGYEIQMKRDGSDEWIGLEVLVNELPCPEKEAEDGVGGA